MPRRLHVKPLEREGARQAFPLVQSIFPELTLEEWLSFARDMEQPQPTTFGPCGIVSVQSGRGYIHGLYSYMVERNLRHGRILEVNNFVALDMADRWGATSRLLSTMDELAKQFDCSAIHVSLPDRWGRGPRIEPTVLSKFEDHGHSIACVGFCKVLQER